MRAAHTYPHQCSAGDCQATIQAGLLMCRTHWSRVSRNTQNAVYSTLREWKKGASVRAYIDAKNTAIAEVARFQESDL